jgi:hypothetical protein
MDREVTAIRNDAFNGDTGITSIHLPEGLVSIGNHAFFGCRGLTAIVIPGTVASIGTAAFQNCTALAEVVIPDSVSILGDYAFYGCAALRKVTLGSGLAAIGTGAFQNCANLARIRIPDGVTHIDGYAFHGCTALEALQCGRGLVSIGTAAFGSSSNIQTAYFLGKAPSLGTSVFPVNAPFVVEHLVAAQGWSNPWNGLPSRPWSPTPENLRRGSNAGFSFDVAGPEGMALSVESTSNLSGNWSHTSNVTIDTNGATFLDAQAVPPRFYRVRHPTAP